MKVTRNVSLALEDLRVPIRLKLSSLWTSLMFCYVYGDYFGLYQPGKLQGMLNGRGPLGPINQGDLVATSILLAIPGLMVFLSLAMPARLMRWTSIVLGLFYAAVMLVTMPGAWWFYIVLGCIEIALSLLIVWSAWTWPRSKAAVADGH